MTKDRACPVCDADLLFSGDESAGDTVTCGYCNAPFVVRKPTSDGDDWDLEDGF